MNRDIKLSHSDLASLATLRTMCYLANELAGKVQMIHAQSTKAAVRCFGAFSLMSLLSRLLHGRHTLIRGYTHGNGSSW